MPVVRFVGYAIAKSLSKVFGLATITFFGRVPSKDDDKVGAVGLISITWYLVLLAIPFPAIGEFIFPFFTDETVLRGLAIVLAITMPLAVGFLVTRIGNRSDEQGARQVARELLFGYGYSIIIGGLVLILVLVVPVVKGSYILRRFDLKHLAIMVDDDDYPAVVERVCDVLDRHGLEPTVEQAHWTIRRIFTALAWMEGHIFRRHVAGDMVIVRGRTEQDEKVEVTVHATDISVLGSQHATTLVMALIAEELDQERLYFSWDDESQAVEDRIRELREDLEAGRCPEDEEVDELCQRLRELSLEAEEWNAVRRHLYRLETACLRYRLAGSAGDDDGSTADEDAAVEARDASTLDGQSARSSTSSSGSRRGSPSASGSSPRM